VKRTALQKTRILLPHLRARIVAEFKAAVANRSLRVAAALGLVVTVAVAYGMWFDWHWKEMIGWKALVHYVKPNDVTGRKDTVQVYAVIVAGVIATITAAVGLANLRLTRKNLEQQRELEDQRGKQQRELRQGAALQVYYEQIGKLITDMELLKTTRREISELARGQTLAILQEVDGDGKGSVLTFLHGAGLIPRMVRDEEGAIVKEKVVDLSGANLRDANLLGLNLREAGLDGAFLERADLRKAHLPDADLGGTRLYGANLTGANLSYASLWNAQLQSRPDLHLEGANLSGANLSGANLSGANLGGADLSGADLSEAEGVTEEQLEEQAKTLEGATMLDGSKHP
jgi:uncharacterized protein YjbI with pentapeptide repeats